MIDAEIKDIIIALIEKDLVHTGTNNEVTGKLIGELYVSIRKTVDDYFKL